MATQAPNITMHRFQGSASAAELAAAERGEFQAANLLTKLAQGFKTLSVPETARIAALANIARWIDDESFMPYLAQFNSLVEKESWDTVLDSFHRVLPFGTGGRRGPVGLGPNRYNPLTLASSVQGHVDFLKKRYGNAGNAASKDTPRANTTSEISVVVAYDVRCFYDLRGIYDPELPSPMLGMSSRDFAELAAGVYAANGVNVHMFIDRERLMSTPELSFSIRHLGAQGGLIVSASHNHPDDNGGKFYNAAGGQEIPPQDEEMANLVEQVREYPVIDFAEAVAAGLITDIPVSVHDAYIALNTGQSLHAGARSARVVFTPLHGTGDGSAGEALEQAGFAVSYVAEQVTKDGRFPAVPFRAPNPEVPESMALGVAQAEREAADLVMSCDPDADRIGVCARTPEGTYRFLNGNELAVLVAHHKLTGLRESGKGPKTPLLIKTDVTTSLLRPIAESLGGVLIGDLLVGFKYHGNILGCLERDGEFGGVEATLDDFVIGVEESHGVLVSPHVRDKDAAGAAVLLAERASIERDRGRTLTQYLDDIYKEYGYVSNIVSSMVMTGAEGLANIQTIQESLRENPPTAIAGQAVTRVIDHRDPNGPHGAILSETDAAARNVLAFELESGARVIIRPSGTEPKNKIYVEVPASPLGLDASDEALAQEKERGDRAAKDLVEQFTGQMLEIIGVKLPSYALKISGLVSLDRRLDFVEGFLPELHDKATATSAGAEGDAELGAWIDARLASYGADARGLVAEAFEAYLATMRTGGDAEQVRSADRMQAIFASA